jgi:hypothetical protein
VRVVDAGQHPVQFDVGVDAAAHPPEQLEDCAFLEDHAGVALLGLGDPGGRVGRQHRPGFFAETNLADVCRGVDERQQKSSRIRLVEGVIRGVLTDGSDGRELAVLRQRPGIPLHHNLIAIGGSAGVGRLDEYQVQAVAQWHHHLGPHPGQRSATPGVPALANQPLAPGQIGNSAHGPSSGCSLNQ